MGGLFCFEKEGKEWDGATTSQTNDSGQGEAWKMSERERESRISDNRDVRKCGKFQSSKLQFQFHYDILHRVT